MKKLIPFLVMLVTIIGFAVPNVSAYTYTLQLKQPKDNSTEWGFFQYDMTQQNGVWVKEIALKSSGGNVSIKEMNGGTQNRYLVPSSITLGQETAVSAGSGDGQYFNPGEGNYRFVYNPSNSKLTVTKSGASEEAKYYAAIKCSSIDNWAEKENEMTADGEGYSYTFENKENFNFRLLKKVGSTSTSYIPTTTNDNALGEYEIKQDNNFVWFGNVTTICKITYYPSTGKLEITEPTVTPPTPTPGTNLQFKSNISGTWNDGVDMTAGANNVWTYNANVTNSTTEFVIKASGNEYHPSATTTVELGKEYKLATGTSGINFKFAQPGDYVVTVNAADINNMTVTVTGTTTPTPAAQYIYFYNAKNWPNLKVWAWDSNNNSCNTNTTWPGDAMTEKDGKWYWEVPSGKNVPTKIIISEDGSNTNRIEDDFVNGKTYTNGSFPDLVLVHSAIGNFNFNNEALKASSADGIYVWKNVSLPAGNFKIGTFGGNWDAPNYGSGCSLVINGVATAMYLKGGDCVLKMDVTNATVTFDSRDEQKMSITISGTVSGYPDLVLYIGGNPVSNQTVSSTDGKYVWKFGKIEAGSTVQLRNAANANDHYAYDGSVSLNRWVYLSNKKDVSTSIPRTLLDGTITANLANNTFKIAGTRDVKPMPDGKFVYFNTGADYFGKMGEKDLYVAFIKNDGSLTTPVKMWDIREYDVNAMLPIFFAKVPDKPGDYKGVEFSVTNGAIFKYNSTKYSDKSSGTSHNTDYDQGNWWKYIYGCGQPITDTESAADQSYITYEDYINVRDGRKTAVYFAGTNLNFTDADGASTAIDWNGNLGESDKNADVYYANFKVTGTEARFKMTWLNVNGRLATYNKDNGKSVESGSQRWWATFNLGIVGPTLPPGVTSSDNVPDVVDKTGTNPAVAFIIPRCREYSRLNQWDWWIPAEQIQDHGTDYTIIIDTDYKTAALLDFKPQPTISVDALSGTETNVIDGTNNTAFTDEQQIEFGKNLLGSASGGTAKIDKVNDVSGKATMTVSNMDFLADSYELSYLIYSGDKLIAEFEGVPGAHHYDIKFNHMAYGANMPISCRAFYHDLKNDTHFRSLYEENKFTATQKQLIQPTLSDNPVTKQVIFKDKDGWHAQVDVEFTIEPVDVPMTVDGKTEYVPLSVYPDFSIVEGSQGTKIDLARQDDFQVQNGMADAHDPNNENGDWVKAAIVNETSHSYRLRLVFRNIEKADADWKTVQGKKYDLEANIIAQYPFYIDYDNDCSYTAYDLNGNILKTTAPAGARRKANGIAEERATGQTVVMSPMRTPATTTVSSTDLSGIIDAEMFGGDGEVELYNLQGIRVVGDPAPGIYLRRCGDKVTKVVVR